MDFRSVSAKINKRYGILLIACLILAGIAISFKYNEQYLLQKEAEKARLLMGFDIEYQTLIFIILSN
jgi:hypothetical protein